MIGAIVNRLRDKDLWAVPASLFYSKDGLSVEGVSIDLILEEQHSIEAVVSEHPVQYGADIADNISIKLRQGSLRALVSNFNRQAASDNGRGMFSKSGNAYTRYDEIRKYESKPLSNRASKAWEDLKAVVEWKQPVKIVTALETYNNVIITSVSTMRDGDTGECQEFDITFRQIRVVSLYEDTISETIVGADMKSSLDRVSVKEQIGGQKIGEGVSAEELQNLRDQGYTD